MKKILKVILCGSSTLCLLLSLVFTMILLTGCSDNKWEIRQTVKPEVLNQLADTIAIKYNLGPFIILDDIKLKNSAQAIYIFKTKDVFELDVIVKWSDHWANNTGFHYYFNESKIGGNYPSRPIDLSILQKAELDIPGFKWLVKDDKKVEESVEISEKESVQEKGLTSQSEESRL